MGQEPHQYTLQGFDVLLFGYIFVAVSSKHGCHLLVPLLIRQFHLWVESSGAEHCSLMWIKGWGEDWLSSGICYHSMQNSISTSVVGLVVASGLIGPDVWMFQRYTILPSLWGKENPDKWCQPTGLNVFLGGTGPFVS